MLKIKNPTTIVGKGSGIVPEGTIYIYDSGFYDVTEYASAEVYVEPPAVQPNEASLQLVLTSADGELLEGTYKYSFDSPDPTYEETIPTGSLYNASINTIRRYTCIELPFNVLEISSKNSCEVFFKEPNNKKVIIVSIDADNTSNAYLELVLSRNMSIGGKSLYVGIEAADPNDFEAAWTIDELTEPETYDDTNSFNDYVYPPNDDGNPEGSEFYIEGIEKFVVIKGLGEPFKHYGPGDVCSGCKYVMLDDGRALITIDDDVPHASIYFAI